MPKNYKELVDFFEQVRYKNWMLKVGSHSEGLFCLKVIRVKLDLSDYQRCIIRGQEWPIDPKMSEENLVCLAFKAIQTEEEKEIRKNFLFQNESIMEDLNLWVSRFPPNKDKIVMLSQ